MLGKVALEGDNEDIKSGGTANVVVGALIDPKLIEKHQIVNVAVKIIHGNGIKDRDLFESFRYEISIMSALPESPYLVKLVGYSMEPMSIVMKRYAMSLQECLDSRDFFKEEWKQHKAMVEIALGMQLVHSKNIIHFDLKPGNYRDFHNEILH